MEMTKNIIIQESPEQVAEEVATLIEKIAIEAVKTRGKCSIALAGGTTPRVTYELLARTVADTEIPWNEIDIFIGDERDVPHDDVESNFGMIQRVLLDNVPVDWKKIHPMQADQADLDKAADEYEQTIRECLDCDENEIPVFDIVLLGLGGDGHTASLFPDTLAIEEADRLVTPNFVPVLGRNRMTLTLPLINSARNIMFVVTGEDKAHMVGRVFSKHDPDMPASRVSPKSGVLHLILDESASKLIK